MGLLRRVSWVQFFALVALVAIGTMCIWSAGSVRDEMFHGTWKTNLATAVLGLAIYAALAWAETDGHGAVPMKDICRAVKNRTLIINTVPAPVADNNVLSFVDPDTLIIDLASMPGGVDFEAAKRRGIKALHALSLPGKTAPLTAGENIADTVLQILKKRGVL
ncbi:MAG: hypothetical protein J5879_05570 [Clostridia bacterium]|nr:hypothetical protein [Clostridia bacterium]